MQYLRGVTDALLIEVDLEFLLGMVEDAERDHVQQRAPDSLDLVSCSCGVAYTSQDRFGESRAHLREAILVETLRTLSGPCATCRGSGTWRKMAGELTCPDCDGFGRTLFPLPPMQYRDAKGAVWQVTKTNDPNVVLVDPR